MPDQGRVLSCPRCKHPYVGPSYLCGCCPHCRVQVTDEDEFYDRHAGRKCGWSGMSLNTEDGANREADRHDREFHP